MSIDSTPDLKRVRCGSNAFEYFSLTYILSDGSRLFSQVYYLTLISSLYGKEFCIMQYVLTLNGREIGRTSDLGRATEWRLLSPNNNYRNIW